jgi:hypothetical protein
MRPPLILFFNPPFGEYPDTSRLSCRGACEFTHDHGRFAEADAVIIHIPACPRI